jgi:hypothetical protein
MHQASRIRVILGIIAGKDEKKLNIRLRFGDESAPGTSGIASGGNPIIIGSIPLQFPLNRLRYNESGMR